jgi:type IV pilus assembly protein PilX
MSSIAYDRVRKTAVGQRGAVLVVGLIFLVLLMLLGVTAYNVATQEERMAGNARDRARAFEAAELALRDCAQYLGSPLPPKFSTSGTLYPGMYYNPPPVTLPDPPPQDMWQTINWDTAMNTTSSGSARWTTVSGTAGPAKCIVERITDVTRQNYSLRAELPQQRDTAYLVSARGVGANSNTQVFLQSYYIRN